MPNYSWIAVLVIGVVLALLGVTNMAKSTFAGWMMIVFAVIFGFVAWKLKTHEEK